jgi:hypothetical protein
MILRMTALALLLAVAGCARTPPPPPATPDTASDSLSSGFVPYCGQIYSADKQGYLDIPCPPGSGYASGR